MELGHNTQASTTALWEAALNVNEKMGKNRGRIKKSEIVTHPEFVEAARCIDDHFWIDILHLCARKKFPRGFGYSDGRLFYRPSELSIVLPDDPKYRAETIIHFLQENGRLYSKRDQLHRRLYQEEAEIERVRMATNDWKRISHSKNRRATHIRDYIERTYAHLPRSTRDELYTQIEVGFDTKFISKEHIQFHDGRIFKIDGLDANERGTFFTRTVPEPTIQQSNRGEIPKLPLYKFHESWQKYLEGYAKYIQSSIKAIHTTLQTSDTGSSESLSIY